MIGCPCGGRDGVVLDGVNLRMKSMNSCIRPEAFAADAAWRNPVHPNDLHLDYDDKHIRVHDNLHDSTAELLRRFSAPPGTLARKDQKFHQYRHRGVEVADLGILRCRLQRSDAGEALSSLQYFVLETPVTKNKADGRVMCYCPSPAAPVLFACVSGYPLSSLLPVRLCDLLEQLLVPSLTFTAAYTVARALALEAPVLCDLVSHVSHPLRLGGALSPPLVVFLRHLLRRSRELAARALLVDYPVVALPSGDPQAITDEEFSISGAYFPYNPVLPERRAHLNRFRYDADRHAKSLAACRKFAPRPGLGTAGVVFVFCTHHSRLLGFFSMVHSESPRTVFEFLFLRFPVAPTMVVYDNACNAHTFCLKREPNFFLHCRFMVDFLHIRGHTACSATYSPYCHRPLLASLRVTNTERAEQFNSELEGKVSQLYYFGHCMFFFPPAPLRVPPVVTR